MLRFTAAKTYRILYFILNKPLFSQTEIKEKLGICAFEAINGETETLSATCGELLIKPQR